MLDFSTNLANELRDRHAEPFWYIKLYYGNESNFTGLSDKDRVIDGVKYRGLVLGWGDFVHSVKLDSFKASNAALNSLTISNADDTISGGRFTDLFSSNNYVNRKFILYQGAVGVAVADHEQIAQGIISDQMRQSSSTLTLSLIEDLSSLEKEVPANIVNTTDHANAPALNIGKPIPMAFGDFGDQTGIGTIPTSGAEFDKFFVKSHFPAIITDQWDETNARVVASPDAETLNTLADENIFYYADDRYSPCLDSNATANVSTPDLTFKGSTWYSYFPLQTWDSYDAGDYQNTRDGDFSTNYTLTVSGAPGATTGWRIPKIPKLGEIIDISIMVDFGTFGGNTPIPGAGLGFKLVIGATQLALTWDGGDQTKAITAHFSTAEQDAWDFESNLQMVIDDTAGTNYDQTVEINQIGIEITYTPPQTFLKEYNEQLRNSTRGRVRVRHEEVNTVEVSEYVYYAGKGREYGAWIDTINSTARATFTGGTDPGYNNGALIENPVYIIEDILRTELGLDPSTTGIDIDVAAFDIAGNTTNGKIGNVFNQSVSNIEFSFCQYKFQSGWELCQEIAAACGCILFYSGDGTVSIAVRERDEDYTSADKTIKWSEIASVSPGITPLADVRNKISVNYNMDYAQDILKDTTAETESATSQGSTANGINSTQELIYDNRFTLDPDTATGYSTALLDWLKFRKKMISFDVLTARHNDLEIGDTVIFSDWPSTFKIYGNEITSTDVYMITKISKRPSGCSITCQEVSEVSD